MPNQEGTIEGLATPCGNIVRDSGERVEVIAETNETTRNAGTTAFLATVPMPAPPAGGTPSHTIAMVVLGNDTTEEDLVELPDGVTKHNTVRTCILAASLCDVLCEGSLCWLRARGRPAAWLPGCTRTRCWTDYDSPSTVPASHARPS